MRRYRITKNDLVVIVGPDIVKDLSANPDMRVTWFAAENRFLQNQLPSNNYSIGGSISLNQDPVIPLSDGEIFLRLTLAGMRPASTWIAPPTSTGTLFLS